MKGQKEKTTTMSLRGPRLFLTFALLALAFAGFIDGVYSYNRPPLRKNLFVRRLDDADDDSPQQVRFNFMSSYMPLCLAFLNFSMNL